MFETGKSEQSVDHGVLSAFRVTSVICIIIVYLLITMYIEESRCLVVCIIKRSTFADANDGGDGELPAYSRYATLHCKRNAKHIHLKFVALRMKNRSYTSVCLLETWDHFVLELSPRWLNIKHFPTNAILSIWLSEFLSIPVCFSSLNYIA